MTEKELKFNTMIAEYQTLNQEVVNRSQQQQSMIGTAWGIAISGGIVALIAYDPSKLTLRVSQNVQMLLLVLPLVLSILTGNHIRNEQKVLTIIQYLYDHLRPQVIQLIGNSCLQENITIWNWPDREYDLSIKSFWEKSFRRSVEFCRLITIHVPGIVVLVYVAFEFGVYRYGHFLQALFWVDICIVLYFFVIDFRTSLEFYSFLKKCSEEYKKRAKSN